MTVGSTASRTRGGIHPAAHRRSILAGTLNLFDHEYLHSTATSRSPSCSRSAVTIDSPTAAPLGTLRSLAYLLPVIDEVIAMRASPDYFHYVRRKLERIAHDRWWALGNSRPVALNADPRSVLKGGEFHPI